VSDFKLFDQALSVSELNDIYQQGLQTHTGGDEEVDR
jgi:hypothetical protein